MPLTSEALSLDPSERLLLCVVRYIGAAYETGDAACWDAAHDAAEAVEGVFDGPLLVARATVLMRLLRRGRGDIEIMPPSSRWLSSDEGSLMTLVRSDEPAEAVRCARRFDKTLAGAEQLAMAAGALPKRSRSAPQCKGVPLAFVTHY